MFLGNLFQEIYTELFKNVLLEIFRHMYKKYI